MRTDHEWKIEEGNITECRTVQSGTRCELSMDGQQDETVTIGWDVDPLTAMFNLTGRLPNCSPDELV